MHASAILFGQLDSHTDSGRSQVVEDQQEMHVDAIVQLLAAILAYARFDV